MEPIEIVRQFLFGNISLFREIDVVSTVAGKWPLDIEQFTDLSPLRLISSTVAC